MNQKQCCQRSCIFCNKDKYLKGTRTREKLSDCSMITADDKVCAVALERNDTAVIAITSNELIAKEARYHATCYRSYTKPVYTPKPQTHSYDDLKYKEVWKFLSDLYDNPEVFPFKRLQELVAMPSEKKNLRRTIENKSDCYRFV